MAFRTTNPFNGEVLETFPSTTDSGRGRSERRKYPIGRPFGGIKTSGDERVLSGLGIQEIVNKKLLRMAAIDAPA